MLSLIICVCEAFGYVYSGMYGDIATIGAGNAILIILQLTFAGIVVIMLDDMMQKGYGLGSGISLFIATNICENILWRALSPITIRTDSGTEFEGALISLIHQLLTKPNKLNALHQAFYRTSSPNFQQSPSYRSRFLYRHLLPGNKLITCFDINQCWLLLRVSRSS